MRLYVPGFAFVVVEPPEVPEPPVVDPELMPPPPPHPEMLIAPIDRTSATNGVNLLLRGAKRKSIPVKETADPAYQCRGTLLSVLALAVVVFCAAVITRVVWADDPAATLTLVAENEKLAAIDESELIEKLTGPLKLFAEVTVNGIPDVVAPDATEIDVVHGVRAKSGFEDETKSATRTPLEEL